MTRTSPFTLPSLALAMAIAAAPFAALAQSAPDPDDQNHDAHHSDAPPAPPPAGNMPSGGIVMMGQGGAAMDDMMQMMTMMRSMMPMMGAAGTMMSSHIEDRIAALQKELKITAAQLPQWTGFADAMRGASHSMSGMVQQMMQQNAGSLPDRIDGHEKLLAQHLVSLRALRDAAAALYPTLTEDQKKQLDGLLVGPMGVM